MVAATLVPQLSPSFTLYDDCIFLMKDITVILIAISVAVVDFEDEDGWESSVNMIKPNYL